MRLALLLEDNRAEFLRMQQELIELLPDDIDVSISKFKQSYRLTCKLAGFDSVYHIKDDATVINEKFCSFIVANLLKPKLLAVGFKAPRGSQSHYHMKTADGRDYTGILLTNMNGLPRPFRIIARHKDIAEQDGTTIYAIADIYSAAGLDRALAYLGSLKHDDSEETRVFE